MRRFINSNIRNFRRFSTEGNAEKIITKTTKTKDGTSIIERINIVEKWSKMSKKQKIALGCYGGFVAGSFLLATYTDGKAELLADRSSRSNNTSKPDDWHTTQDWTAVKKGCSHNVGANFWSSIIFPAMWVKDTMPGIILVLNPNKGLEEEKKKQVQLEISRKLEEERARKERIERDKAIREQEIYLQKKIDVVKTDKTDKTDKKD